MLDPLLYRWGVPPVVIMCVHWTMQMWVLQAWIKALGLYIVMLVGNEIVDHSDVVGASPVSAAPTKSSFST